MRKLLFILLIATTANAMAQGLTGGHHKIYQGYLAKKLSELTPLTYGNEEDQSIVPILFINGLSREVHTLLKLCLNAKTDSEKTTCFYENFSELNRISYQDKVIDKVTYSYLNDLIRRASFKNNVINIKFGKKGRSASIVDYLVRKNQILNLKKGKTGERELDPEVLKLANRYYKRKIPGVGRVTMEEYMYYTYSQQQQMNMANLLHQSIHMMNSSKAEILIFLKDDDEDYYLREYEMEVKDLVNKITFITDEDQVNAMDKKIIELSHKIKELEDKSLFIKLNNELTSFQQEQAMIISMIARIDEQAKRLESYEKIQSLKSKIKAVEAKLAEYKKSIELSNHDIYKFTISYLEYNIQKESFKGYLKGTNANLGDLVMAGYLTGKLDKEILKALFNMRELQENWEPGWKKAGRIMASAAKSLLILTPLTAPYASLAFVVFDSIKNIKNSRQDQIDDAHLL